MSQILARLSPYSRELKRRSRFYRYLHAYAYAFRDLLIPKNSYSQWGEDRILLDWFNRHGGINPAWIYIDVGANHPTLLSDTFLFYRRGHSGICIEPNRELARMFCTIRRRDIVLNVAAGNQAGELEFYVTENPVFSSLLHSELEDRLAQSYRVPVIRLDELLPQVQSKQVFLLKVDTEGYDQQVLEGALALLNSVMVVLTETRSDAERQDRVALLGQGWKTIYAKANTILVNERFFPQ